MSAVAKRRVAILEPVAVFALIMAYIWDLRYTHPAAWLAILGLMVFSHRLRGEHAQGLGFRSQNLRDCLDRFAPALGFIVLLMLGCGILLQTTRHIAPDRAMLSWAAYLPWGLLQQYVLNGYFMNRFDSLASRRAAPLISAALFSGAHLPNWFLMSVTLVAGYLCTRIYRRYKNLYFLAIAHATVGILLFLVVPDSISRHLSVGPGWFR